MLTESAVSFADQYELDGFLIPTFQMAPDKLRTAQQLCARVIDGAANETIPNPHLPASHPAGVSGGGLEIFQTMLDPGILSILRELIGPDIVLWSMGLFAKRSLTGGRTTWHQDANFWPIRPVESACTVWMSLDGSDVENGCVEFVSGSHRDGLQPHGHEGDTEFRSEVTLDAVRNGLVKPATLLPGQISVHCSHVIHGAAPNRSGRPRTGLAAQFMSASAYYDRSLGPDSIAGDRGAELYKRRPIWLVSGANRHELNDFVVGHEGLQAHDEFAEEVRSGAPTGRAFRH